MPGDDSAFVDVVIRELGGDGLAWVRTSLEGGGAISDAFLACRLLEQGSVVTPLPPDAPISGSFAHGGVVPLRANAGLARIVAPWCVQPNWLVLEDELALRRDPRPDLGRESVIAYIGDRIVTRLGLGGAAADEVGSFMRKWSSGYPGNAFVVRDERGLLAVPRAMELDQGAVETLAAQTVAVIVSAFDAEGFLVWTANERKASIARR